jgi:Domain of unknown function (DUF4188)
LLLHQFLLFGLVPPHLGIRQYWRDFDALERWARSEPHQRWWQALLRDPGGTGFWHETYFIRGGIESIFLDVDPPTGLLSFGPAHEARARCSRPDAGCGCTERNWFRPDSPRRSSTRPAELPFPVGAVLGESLRTLPGSTGTKPG